MITTRHKERKKCFSQARGAVGAFLSNDRIVPYKSITFIIQKKKFWKIYKTFQNKYFIIYYLLFFLDKLML